MEFHYEQGIVPNTVTYIKEYNNDYLDTLADKEKKRRRSQYFIKLTKL